MQSNVTRLSKIFNCFLFFQLEPLTAMRTCAWLSVFVMVTCVHFSLGSTCAEIKGTGKLTRDKAVFFCCLNEYKNGIGALPLETPATAPYPPSCDVDTVCLLKNDHVSLLTTYFMLTKNICMEELSNLRVKTKQVL